MFPINLQNAVLLGRLIDTARLIEALPMLIIVMLLSSCGKRISMPLAATFLVSIFSG